MAVVRSGPTEYVSGPLGNSDVLRRLAAERQAKEDEERGKQRRKRTARFVASTEMVEKSRFSGSDLRRRDVHR